MSSAIVFYDGDCGLCHASVKFVITRDARRQFRYAPLGGDTFVERLGKTDVDAASLPDSIVVLTPDDELLTRSSAIIYLLRRLSRPWSWLGALLAVVPRFLRDLGYRLVARTRRRFFTPPEGVCPVMPRDQRLLFDP